MWVGEEPCGWEQTVEREKKALTPQNYLHPKTGFFTMQQWGETMACFSESRDMTQSAIWNVLCRLLIEAKAKDSAGAGGIVLERCQYFSHGRR